MDILNKKIPFLSSLIILVIFEILLIRPKATFLYFIILLVIFSGLYLMTGRRIFNKNLWLLFLAPVLLMTSGFIFIYFLETNIFKQILIFFLCIFNWILLRNYHLYLVFRERQQKIMENILSYISIISAFLFFSSFFALRIFLYIKIIWLEVLVLVMIILLIMQNFWILRIEIKKSYLFIIVLSLLFLECFWAVIFLPTNYLVNGFFLTVLFYILINLSRHQILKTLQKKVLSRYLILGVGMVILVFITARWI